MKKVKRSLLTLLFIAFSVGSFAQQEGKLEIPLTDPEKRGVLKVDIKSGSIDVKGYDGKNVVVNYRSRERLLSKSAKSDSEGLKRIPGSTIDLEGTEHENTVIVNSSSWNKGVDLSIEVPKEFDVKVETYNNGNIFVDNIAGEVVAKNYNGRITLENISGLALANTYNGDIKISYNEVTPDTPMAYNTYNGKVDLTFPQDVKANFKMKSSRGEIFSAFDMQVEPTKPVTRSDSKSGVYKVKVNEWIQGKINGGGPEVTIKTYNGNIYIRKKGG